MMKIISEGASGNWFIKSYKAPLEDIFQNGFADILLVDIVDLDCITPIQFINKKLTPDKIKEHQHIDVVLIVSRPDTHISVIQYWAQKTSKLPFFLVEKPLDVSVEKIKHWFQDKDKNDTAILQKIFMIDHYFLKCLPVYPILERFFHNDKIRDVKIRITESKGIKLNAKNNLKVGAISDLLTHSLLPLIRILNLINGKKMSEIAKDASNINGFRLKHNKSPIHNETFAKIHCTIEEFPVEINIGKGIGQRSSKNMLIRTNGNHKYLIDFIENTMYQDNIEVHSGELIKNPIEVFLRELVKGSLNSITLNQLGLVDFETAFQMINLTRKMQKLPIIGTYKMGESLKSVISRFEKSV